LSSPNKQAFIFLLLNDLNYWIMRKEYLKFYYNFKLSKMKKLLFIIWGSISAMCTQAQTLDCGTYTKANNNVSNPDSTSEIAFMDRFGNYYTSNELAVPNGASFNNYCNCGSINTNYFQLAFQDCANNTGDGFDDPNLGPARRASLCSVFRQLSLLITQQTGVCGSPQNVRVLIQQSNQISNPFNPNTLGYATDFYGLNRYPDRRGILDFSPWLAINTGTDPSPGFLSCCNAV
jgi:hypothetical protein